MQSWLGRVRKNGGSVPISLTLTKPVPKTAFLYPLVDCTAGLCLLNFVDAYSGYNKILMAEENQEKTSFITDKGLYYYKVMPFGLKNARENNQRLVNAMFKEQIGHNMEVYVDDIKVEKKGLISTTLRNASRF